MAFHPALAAFLIFLRVAALIFIGVGNGIVIYVMCLKKNLQRQSNHYVLSVAIADWLVGVITIPIGISTVRNRLCLFGKHFE